MNHRNLAWEIFSLSLPWALQEGFQASSLTHHWREHPFSAVPQFPWHKSLESAGPTRPPQHLSLKMSTQWMEGVQLSVLCRKGISGLSAGERLGGLHLWASFPQCTAIFRGLKGLLNLMFTWKGDCVYASFLGEGETKGARLLTGWEGGGPGELELSKKGSWNSTWLPLSCTYLGYSLLD